MRVRILLDGLTLNGKMYRKGTIIDTDDKCWDVLTSADLRNLGRVAEEVEEEGGEPQAKCLPAELTMETIVVFGKYKDEHITWEQLLSLDRAYVVRLLRTPTINIAIKTQIKRLLGE